MKLILVFLIKVLDNVLGTTKTILIQKGQPFLAALSVIGSQIIFFKIVSQVVKGDSDLILYTVSIASGVGTYLAIKFNSKFSKDRTYTHILLCDDMEIINQARDYFILHKIDNLLVPTLTRDGQPTNSILVFAHTKNESKQVDSYVDNSKSKIKRVIQRN